MRPAIGLLILLLAGHTSVVDAQQVEGGLWFGVVVEGGRTTQARFETTVEDGRFSTIVHAPYGFTPNRFAAISQDGDVLSFTWLRQSGEYVCSLRRDGPSLFHGSCLRAGSEALSLVLRQFGPEDAKLQGNDLGVTVQDLAIVRRARVLLVDGRSWNRKDDRICDAVGYPYRWSLFCALHQASIEVDSDYRHLRPAIRAVREAIQRQAPGRRFAHMLQDFNNEATNFQSILAVLAEAESALDSQLREPL
jgi:hypothetical protein